MRLGTAALAVALGLGLVGLAPGQEEPTGSWLPRFLNPRPGRPTPKTEPIRIDPAAAALSDAERQKQAWATFERRLKACLALRELADRLDDDDLRRKADELDHRAWQVYQATRGTPPTAAPERIILKENR